MVKRNPNLQNLPKNYLFVEIANRKEQFLRENPGAKLISLGIGDTTEPIPPSISRAMEEKAKALGTREGYQGYGTSQGEPLLRKKIAETLYQGRVSSEDVFISDGAKCDIARLQTLFGPGISIALQDPVYPAYLGNSLLNGVNEIITLPCTKENGFFPDLDNTPKTDLIYFCAPNNPTGVVPTKSQLEKLVQFAKKNRSILLYDSAYSFYITDPGIPRSIYEIAGAEEVAIETGSFSKFVGFTGVRLGWTIVPKALSFEEGASVRSDWITVISNAFNGASNIAQAGGIAALEPQGLKEANGVVAKYLQNVAVLRNALEEAGFPCYGGEHAPYLWIDLKGASSWEMFDLFLKEAHLVTTPGVGFGKGREGYLRVSAFGHPEAIQEAAGRIASLRPAITR